MSALNILIAQGEVCSCLREKQMFYETAEAPSTIPQGPFWCARTQSLLGPDGGVAEVEKCRPGRECYEGA